MQGTRLSGSGTAIGLFIRRCLGREDCASPAEIDRFLEAYQLNYVYNTMEYQPSGYGEDTLKEKLKGPFSYKLD